MSNRTVLDTKDTSVKHGFESLFCEWWHFTLGNEPYPDTYFEFPVSTKYLK